ncbi:hypothetical protein [uncultured Cohaesibacter sp.]|uniref:hypothetical protein n=1 Tax=uncultured Cohaesibacter sp. TaxID=1002546 RepID=UPI0029C8DC25|nr:hypothetical protein [uncultured Cohaesibacter sp.]
MSRRRRTIGTAAEDRYAARQPDPERSWLDRLLGNLMLVGSAFALTGLVFYLFLYWQGGDLSGSEHAAPSSMEAKSAKPEAEPRTETFAQSGRPAPQVSSSTAPQQALPADDKRSDEVQLLLQGPQAGKLVSPPERNVTPGYALSPYYQAAPLERESGMPLPPEPEPDPLPQIFPRATVQSPTRLTLMVSKYREVDVQLAHLKAGAAEQDCWMAGRAAKCSKLGATALQRFIRARAVRCDWIGQEGASNNEKAKSGSDMASCYLGPGVNQFKAGEEPVNVTDLASWVVRFGWAEPEEGYYQDEMFEAKEAKRGLYATKETASSGDIIARQQESDALSSELRAQSEAIGPITSPDLLAGANAGALSIMVAPSSEDAEEKELPLPPGFEMR